MKEYISTSAFKLESLGVQQCEVYDLSVEANENFIANDILVHNSNYVNMEAIAERKFGKNFRTDGTSTLEVARWLHQFIEGDQGKNNGMISNFLSSSFEELKDYLNCTENHMNMALEKIASNALFKNNKKRYAMSVIYDEGTWYTKSPKLSVTGLESVSSKTPMFARRFLEETYQYILNNHDSLGLKTILDRQEYEFYQMDIDDIAESMSINTGVDKINAISSSGDVDVLGNSVEYNFEKGTSYGLKAAHIHNVYNKENNIHIKPISTNGIKVKVLPLKSPNTITTKNVNIAYVGTFPNEWESDVLPQVDKSFIWYKRYIRTVDGFTDALDYQYKSENIEYDLF